MNGSETRVKSSETLVRQMPWTTRVKARSPPSSLAGRTGSIFANYLSALSHSLAYMSSTLAR